MENHLLKSTSSYLDVQSQYSSFYIYSHILLLIHVFNSICLRLTSSPLLDLWSGAVHIQL